MGRLVDAKPAGPQAAAGNQNGSQTVQDYLQRVAKYVPAEVVAAYLTLLPVIMATTTDSNALRKWLLGVLLGIGIVFTPLYLKFMAEPGQPKRMHLMIGTVGFVIWAYSIGGLFTILGWYQAAVAAILLVVFSLTSGLFVPTEGTK